MSVRTKVVTKENHKNRLKKHRVSPEVLGALVSKRAEASGSWSIEMDVGLDYEETLDHLPQVVECAVAVASPLGLAVVWVSRTSGARQSAVTATNSCVEGAGALWDGRASDAKREWAMDLLREAHKEHWTPLETLAAMAE